MKPIFIGITGGSGAGKSTLAFGLLDKYPEKIGILHFDDYHKKRELLPVFQGKPNADHPGAIELDTLVKDLEKLKNGEPVYVFTKSERYNPKFQETKVRNPLTVNPKQIMLLEGFMVLHDTRVRALLDYSIYLDAEHTQRYSRRAKPHLKSPEYEQGILIPMHNKYVEPTKKLAKVVIDVSHLSKEEVLEHVEKLLKAEHYL